MFAQTTTLKRKPRKMPDSVIQGSRILGQTGGRPAQMYMCEKSLGICPAESPLEKVIGQLASLDPRVRTVRPQPFTVDVISGQIFHNRQDLLVHRKTREKSESRLREYTPDFSFDLIDGRRIIVEVKDHRYVCEQAYWEKVEKAKRLLLSNGYRFQVIFMEYEPSAPLVHNADLITAFRNNFKKTITDAQLATIEADVGDSVSSLGHVAELAGLTLRDAPVLVIQGIVSADIAAGPLGSRTPVRLAYGDLHHLSVLNFEGDAK